MTTATSDSRTTNSYVMSATLIEETEFVKFRADFMDDRAMVDPERYGIAFQFFKDVQNRIMVLHKPSGAQLHDKGFGFMKKIGKDLTMENTAQVYDFSAPKDATFSTDSIASVLRALGSVQTREQSINPDVSLRFSMNNDVDILSADDAVQETLKPHCSRLVPWNIIGHIELKKQSESLSRSIFQAQCFEYCDNLIKISPGRKYAFTALTNFTKVVFFCVYHVDDDYFRYLRSQEVSLTPDEWAHSMATFVAVAPGQLGFVDQTRQLLLLREHKLLGGLGRGSCSAVVECEGGYALKVSIFQHALQNEYDNFIAIRKSGDNLLQYLPELEKLDNNTYRMSKVYSKMTREMFAKKEVLVNLWSLLRLAHRAGIVHRDLRVPNIAYLSVAPNSKKQYAQRVVLLDWGSSLDRNKETVADYMVNLPVGCTATASLRVRRLMDQAKVTEQPGNYIVTPDDEGISMIYLAMQVSRFGDRYFKNGKHSYFPHVLQEHAANMQTTAKQIHAFAVGQPDVVTASIKALTFGEPEHMDRTENKDYEQMEASRNTLVLDALNYIFTASYTKLTNIDVKEAAEVVVKEKQRVDAMRAKGGEVSIIEADECLEHAILRNESIQEQVVFVSDELSIVFVENDGDASFVQKKQRLE